ncbi:hypothetical protein AHAS_Ahas01G0065600 [Arachis hypogaea]
MMASLDPVAGLMVENRLNDEQDKGKVVILASDLNEWNFQISNCHYESNDQALTKGKEILGAVWVYGTLANVSKIKEGKYKKNKAFLKEWSIGLAKSKPNRNDPIENITRWNGGTLSEACLHVGNQLQRGREDEVSQGENEAAQGQCCVAQGAGDDTANDGQDAGANKAALSLAGKNFARNKENQDRTHEKITTSHYLEEGYL